MADSPANDSQRASSSFSDELWQLARLAGPIALVQFGTTALSFVDVAMLGRHEPAALPAMALGNTLGWAMMMFAFGVQTAADPLLSQAVGARDHEAVPRLLGRTLLLGVALTIPSALMLLPSRLWLTWFGQPEALIGDAATYAQLQALGVLPFLWYSAARALLSAHARMAPQVLTIVAGNAVNVALDYWLIFGGLGVPPLGATGAGIATVAVRWAMLFALVWFGRHELWPHLLRLREAAVRQAAFALGPLLRLLRLGTPVGAQFLLEIGIFAAAGLLIGILDAQHGGAGTDGPMLAGHQIALQLAAMSFMIPLGIGIAASVRVGWAVGRGDHDAVRRSCRAALVAGGATMTLFMIAFLLWPGPLARLLGEHENALAVAIALIPIAGVFQIGDGLQVVAVGCLRGLGDLRSAVVANVIGFWVLGLPLGCLFTFGLGFGPEGLWWGLVLGLSGVAAILLVVLRWRTQSRRERLAAD
ncbi:MAG: MATE family efflux transporter [bacterium]|nr:MATE family efflux transporter [bacterium]